jgi:hypothetical protein
MRKTGLFMVLVVLVMVCPALIAAAASQDMTTFDSIQVIRSAPEQATVGDKVVISLEVINTGTVRKTVELKEFLSTDADFDQAAAVKTVISHTGEGQVCFGVNCSSQPRTTFSQYTSTTYSYLWNIPLNPGEKKQVSYGVVPRYVGEYLIRPADLKINDKEYFLPATSIQVACRSGHPCDTANGENAITCPENCAGSSTDAICNPAKDGQCDPDCASGADPDCTKGTPPAATQQKNSIPLGTATILCALGVAGCIAVGLRKK